MRVAQRDRRVDEAVFDQPRRHRVAGRHTRPAPCHKLAKVLDPAWIRRLPRGQIRLTTIADALRSAAVLAPRPGADRCPPGGRVVGGQGDRGGVRSAGIRRARVVLAFSGDEVVEHDLARAGVLAQLGRWPNVEYRVLPGRDHTVRPMSAQSATLDLLAEVVARQAI